MRIVRRALNCILTVLCANAAALCVLIWNGSAFFPAAAGILLIIFFIAMLCRPQRKQTSPKGLQILSDGYELLLVFLISVTVTAVFQLYFTYTELGMMLPWNGADSAVILGLLACSIAAAVIFEALVFWCGIIRLYITSVQLGIKHRVLGILFGWIPVLNIYYLIKIMRTVKREIDTESEKICLNAVRKENFDCATRYPILLVHGVFFRDCRYFNYWGRISAELKRNGAEIYYGNQQSAASVEECGRELADRISEIIKETGCKKVNIIAHSKGGLDSRAAISHFGAAPFAASLTTVNTPHRGCIFADYLLEKIPEKIKLSVSRTYNAALKRLGDKNPDFLAAVSDLTASVCAERNKDTPDAAGVFYQSVMSCCKKARSGKFPLNLSYPLVQHFDGENDGLVSVDSAEWGEKFTLIRPSGKRGVSHGDMIDLNRENIPGFDVREFYVSLVRDLKDRGF